MRMLSEHPLLPAHESEEADAWKAELAAHVRNVVTTRRIEMRKLPAQLFMQVQRDRLISAAVIIGHVEAGEMLLELGGHANCPACGFWLRRLGVLVFAGHFVAALLVVTALNRSAVINLQRLDRREPAQG